MIQINIKEIKTQKELTERLEKSNAEQREEKEVTERLRAKMQTQFEDYMLYKDTDMTRKVNDNLCDVCTEL